VSQLWGKQGTLWRLTGEEKGRSAGGSDNRLRPFIGALGQGLTAMGGQWEWGAADEGGR
jgi:hypothetical protein